MVEHLLKKIIFCFLAIVEEDEEPNSANASDSISSCSGRSSCCSEQSYHLYGWKGPLSASWESLKSFTCQNLAVPNLQQEDASSLSDASGFRYAIPPSDVTKRSDGKFRKIKILNNRKIRTFFIYVPITLYKFWFQIHSKTSLVYWSGPKWTQFFFLILHLSISLKFLLGNPDDCVRIFSRNSGF